MIPAEAVEAAAKAMFPDNVKAQDWQGLLYLLVLVVPLSLLFMWGFADLSFWIRLPVYVVLGITLLKCEQWVVARRIRKTIQAMRDM